MKHHPSTIRPEDLGLVFPNPSEPLLAHAHPRIPWERWIQECADRTNAYLQNHDRANDPTLSTYEERFVLE